MIKTNPHARRLGAGRTRARAHAAARRALDARDAPRRTRGERRARVRDARVSVCTPATPCPALKGGVSSPKADTKAVCTGKFRTECRVARLSTLSRCTLYTLDPALPSAATHRVWRRRTAAVAARRATATRRRRGGRGAAPARAAAGGGLGALLGEAAARHAQQQEPLRRTLELALRALVLLRARLLQVRGLAAVLALEVPLPVRELAHEPHLPDAERLEGVPREVALAAARAAVRGAAPTAGSDGGAAGGTVPVPPASAVRRGRGEQAARLAHVGGVRHVLRGAAPRRRGQRRREQIASVGREAASLTLRQAEADFGRRDPAASAAGRRGEGGGGDAALAVVGRAPSLRALAYLGVQPAWATGAAG